jgi:hypothetical protein
MRELEIWYISRKVRMNRWPYVLNAKAASSVTREMLSPVEMQSLHSIPCSSVFANIAIWILLMNLRLIINVSH